MKFNTTNLNHSVGSQSSGYLWGREGGSDWKGHEKGFYSANYFLFRDPSDGFTCVLTL